ncbi:MAG: hypothetical protein AAFZ18_25510 [Myxococcota bacterium]
MREALTPLAPGLRRFAVAGRTDRGVSASGQVVSFRADEALHLDTLGAAVDASAPGELTCLRSRYAPHGFHAQFWARARRYAYHYPAPQGSWRLASGLDRRMRALVGRRCFHAFARETPIGRSTVRHLFRAGCQPGHLDETPVLRFELCADGFLRRLVRVVVATALDAAWASAPDGILRDLAETQDRSRTSSPAPPEPLVFVGPVYDPWCP